MSKAAEQFFYKHAGYSYPSGATKAQQTAARRAYAKALAHAEAEAANRGWRYEWEHDPEAETDWMDQEQLEAYEAGRLEILSVVLRDENGEVLESLGGVGTYARGGRDPHLRVIEAELAHEALPTKANPITSPWSKVFG